MQVKSYKEYRKEVNKIIKENKDIQTCKNKLLDYYSNHNISKEHLMKRYNNISCNERNLSSYFSGIVTGIISGFISSMINNIIGFIGAGIMLCVCLLPYNFFIKYLDSGNDVTYIYPYEKLLIEEYLKEKYHFEVNPTEVKLIKPIKNNPSKIENSKSIEN